MNTAIGGDEMTGTRAPKGTVQEDRSVKPPVVLSRTLFGQHRELIIEHGSDQYRLLITSNNKLILMK